MSVESQMVGVQVEWLILADAAQVVGNKLYLMGGGWDVITVNQGFPINHQLAVALSIRVPWHETNQRHDFEVEITSDDGASLAKMNGQFEVGRPPGIKPGQSQRTQIAFGAGLRLEKAGTYVVVARLSGQEHTRYPFAVIQGASAAQKAA